MRCNWKESRHAWERLPVQTVSPLAVLSVEGLRGGLEQVSAAVAESRAQQQVRVSNAFDLPTDGLAGGGPVASPRPVFDAKVEFIADRSAKTFSPVDSRDTDEVVPALPCALKDGPLPCLIISQSAIEVPLQLLAGPSVRIQQACSEQGRRWRFFLPLWVLDPEMVS